MNNSVHALELLSTVTCSYGVVIALAKHRVFCREQQGLLPELILCGDRLQAVNSFRQIGIIITTDRGV